MAQEAEAPPVCVTEIAVRLDCNGCIQRVKRALQRVAGVSGVSIDAAQNKITLTGVATLEMIMKAMKKTKKPITVISHTPTIAAAAPADSPPVEAAPPAEAPPAEAPPEPEKTAPPVEAPPEPEKTAAPPVEAPPEPEKKQPSSEEAQMVHHYPHHHLRRDSWPENVIYSYNRHRPIAGMAEYVNLQPLDYSYQRQEHYSGGFYNPHQTLVTSIFSDENPNACTLM